MNSIIKLATIVAFSTMAFTSCKKGDDTSTPTTDTGKVYMEFFNAVGGSNLSLGNQWYKNEHGDSFTVSKFNYYISNIVLNGSGNTPSYTENNSYHLIEHSSIASQMAFNMFAVPYGKYKSVTFMIGVDSLHNVSGAQSGDLDPAKGNFWSWNTGYIMLKFEGNSPRSPNTNGMMEMHCGGFSGINSVLRTVTLDFPTEIEVSKFGTPHIHLQADLLRMFKSPNVIDFATSNLLHMPGPAAKALADDYANMFSVTYAGL